MILREELPSLKERARTIGHRIDLLERRVRSLQEGASLHPYRPVVDSEKCLGCGVCEGSCPLGAIAVNRIAQIDMRRCIGCGRCAGECPHGAITLDSGGPVYEIPGRHKQGGRHPAQIGRRNRNAPLRISVSGVRSSVGISGWSKRG